jgi:hypothetical protein
VWDGDEYNPKIIICRLKFLMYRVELKVGKTSIPVSDIRVCSKPTVWDSKTLLFFATLEFSHLFLMHRVELKD